jgi:tetratricopeptide (TPR) repeat protein
LTVPRSEPNGLFANARAFAAQGDWEGLVASLTGREPEVAAHPELAVTLAEAQLQLGDLREAGAWLEYAVPLLERWGNGPDVQRAINMLGAARFELGDLPAAEAAFERALLLATVARSDLTMARATNNLGLIANLRGQPGAALALYRLAVPALQRIGRPRELAQAFHNMAISYRDLRQLDEADRHERRAVEFARQADDPRMLAMARVGRADLSLRRGEPRVAEVVASLAARQLAEIRDPIGQADALRLAGAARLALGVPDLALPVLMEAVGLAREHGNALVEAEALAARADCWMALGQVDRARTDADDAMALYDRLGASAERRALEERWKRPHGSAPE